MWSAAERGERTANGVVAPALYRGMGGTHGLMWLTQQCVPVVSALADVHAGSAPEYADEFPIARLCDSGLPDPEVCDVLHVPPREARVVSEAWSRGCAVH